MICNEAFIGVSDHFAEVCVLEKGHDGNHSSSQPEPAEPVAIIPTLRMKPIEREPAADSTPQRFCNCPVISPRQVEDGECSLCGLELEPEANSTRLEPLSAEHVKELADAAYCNYIEQMKRPECLGYEQKLKEGAFSSVELAGHGIAREFLGRHKAFSEILAALKSAHAASVQQEPLSTEPDPWKRIKQQWIEIGNLKQSLKEHVAKIHNQREEINRLLAAAPRTQGSEPIRTEDMQDFCDDCPDEYACMDAGICRNSVPAPPTVEDATQPQPAPRPPVCPSEAEIINWLCSNGVFLQRWGWAQSGNEMREVKILQLFAQQFFTAIPATTLEVISGAKVVKVDAEALKNYAGKKLKDVSGFDDTNPAPAITDEEKR